MAFYLIPRKLLLATFLRRLFRKLKNPYGVLYSDEFIFRHLPEKRKHAWLISAPKSGSTWLSVLLEEGLGWDTLRLMPKDILREEVPEIMRFMQLSRSRPVFTPRTHTRYSQSVHRMVEKADIGVIVQVRNIFDMVISYLDHLNNDRTGFIVPVAFMNFDSWKQLSDTEKTSFIIEMVVPWYFGFYCGWMTSNLMKDGHVYLCQYERLKSDPLQELQRILDFLEEGRAETLLREIVEASDQKPTKMNYGFVGRGRLHLNDEQKAKIVSYASFYRGVDFGPLGISDSGNRNDA